jgi:ABC-2 type transport system permease protein
MTIKAFVIRILRQFMRDKRTLGLMILAPILVLTMLWAVFNGKEYKPKIGYTENAVQQVVHIKAGSSYIHFKNEAAAKKALKENNIDGYLLLGTSPSLVLEGSDPNINQAVIRKIQTLFQSGNYPSLNVEYLHGKKDMKTFDYFGPVLLGFFVFFFVFLISGVSFLRERTSGTLERLMASPIKVTHMVLGYVLGFGLFTIVQSALISSYSVYVLNLMMVGSFLTSLFIILLLSLTALTLGMLLSAFARTELQMMQFIPIIVVPQIFFSGLFNLDTIPEWLSWIGPITPLYYAADALRDVMIRGAHIQDVLFDILMLLGFSVFFILVNIAALRKYRKI